MVRTKMVGITFGLDELTMIYNAGIIKLWEQFATDFSAKGNGDSW